MYAPLKYCIECEASFNDFEEFMKDICKKKNIEFTLDINESERVITEYGFLNAFVNPNSKYYEINKRIFNDKLGRLMFGDVDTTKYPMSREFADMFCLHAIVREWSKNKQVLKCDDDFIQALASTDGIKIPADITKQLPFRTFLIDFQDNHVFEDWDYVFVNIQSNKECIYFTIARVVNNEIFFILNDIINEKVKDENGNEYYTFKKKDIEIHDEVLDINPMAFPSPKFYNHDIKNTDKREAIVFIWQLVLYMLASNKDVAENPTTKATYKKTPTVKNKFSEIQQWDVGYVWGKTFRLKNKNNVEHREGYSRGADTRERKSPRPHFRNAHWSHYWTGTGRTKLELRWIEPVYVNSTEENPVVMHEVK